MNNIFNNGDLYPTPQETIYKMLQYFDVNGKVILEPSAGKGDIINVLIQEGAKEVLYCEKSEVMQKTLNGLGRFMCADFLDLKAEQISHINAIIMNPPFSEGVKHVLHAYDIAPKGATIISLINSSNLKNDYTNDRKQLNSLILANGSSLDLGKCFDNAERKTNVDVTLICIKKAGESYESEFEGFFMDEEPETEGVNGIMQYDAIRDLVNRYVAAVKLYDEQLNTGVKMNNLLKGFYGKDLTFSCSEEGKVKLRADFKKDMQRAGWDFVFKKLDLYKDVTSATMADINKFVEEQTNIPFTVKNIWQMLSIIVATRGQTMDRALLAVFDRLTTNEDNRYNEKWKSNLHYLLGKKFILGDMVYQDQRWYKGSSNIQIEGRSRNFELMEDFNKALAYITGINYNSIGSLENCIRYEYKIKTKDNVYFYHGGANDWSFENKKKALYEQGIEYTIERSQPIYGEWFNWGYFRCKAFKKGSMHFEWLDLDLWGKFNQRISKLKGYPLYEQKEQTAYQKRNAGYKTEPKTKETKQEETEILFSFEL
jgi:hypothetical protein